MNGTEPETWQASDTDVFVRYGDAFVPQRRAQIESICDLVTPLPTPEILDLGCGDGKLTAELLQRFPTARVTALDGSARMLELAGRRLAPFGTRVRLQRAALEDRGWRSGTYGAVVTSLAVHHLADPDKRQLYQDLNAMLVPGAVFVMADLVRPATRATTALAARRWDAEVARQSVAIHGGPAAADAFRETRWNTFTHPDPVDRPATLVEHLDWLRAAGFVDVDACWMLAGHVLLTASRAAATEAV
ncbi:class I SAM-dependent methyltransferase [Micromonospora sp. NPDC049523]|uniref:class I SAM-dependent methyltransferase n=1 Tax=Micromonospora sp. NPDC049523 TaxID=3155921 RepID=UPI00343E11EF